jgi:hypothetical protein
MNQLLPSQVHILGKREKNEQSENTTKDEEKPQKRQKTEKSYKQFSKDAKEKLEAEEMLNKYLVTPKITFADLGGLEKVV